MVPATKTFGFIGLLAEPLVFGVRLRKYLHVGPQRARSRDERVAADEDVTKELNLFVEKEGRRILDTYMPVDKAWRIATR